VGPTLDGAARGGVDLRVRPRGPRPGGGGGGAGGARKGPVPQDPPNNAASLGKETPGSHGPKAGIGQTLRALRCHTLCSYYTYYTHTLLQLLRVLFSTPVSLLFPPSLGGGKFTKPFLK